MMIEPRKLSYKDFPASRATAEGMKISPLDENAIFCRVVYNQGYCVRDGYPLHMHLLLPSQHEQPEKIWPLIVFIQGSAFQFGVALVDS
ncbi:hypothetical protein [Candidatus Pristimantibacillus sp. PTI5]|uniref:hypothetical protein n=1 Tax=Candidatus Pristimantibacillus sp. PTI5 TaxID=3400422 RepID=UPI003B020A56